MSDRPFVVVTMVLGLLRLIELRISRRNERQLELTGRPGAAASTFPVMAALHVALFTLPLFEIHRARPRRLLGGAMLLLAVILRWWCIRTLGRQWNVRAATPQSFSVIGGGPYRFVRHPNYLAVALEFLALPLFGGAWKTGAVLSAANSLVLWQRVVTEEAVLNRQPEYLRLMGHKPRFIPGLG